MERWNMFLTDARFTADEIGAEALDVLNHSTIEIYYREKDGKYYASINGSEKPWKIWTR